MSLKMFTFMCRNEKTKETATLIGQGTTVEEAFKEAWTNAQSKWRPDSNGGGTVLDLNVELPDGKRVGRSKADFEGDKPYKSEPETRPMFEEDCP